MAERTAILMGNVGRDEVRETLDRIRPLVESHADVVEFDLESDPARVPESIDLALVVGGDGSILKASRSLAPAGVPCMGVNIGRLGFMAGFREADLPDALPTLLAGGGRRHERIMLSIRIEKRDGHHLQKSALNDVAVSYGTSHRLIAVTVDVDREPVATYRGDGVMVATPTGSTAYNLAAGGPILQNRLDAVVITPICPHMLTHRSIVVDADTPVTLRPTEDQRESTCIIDGQLAVSLVTGDVVHIGKAWHRFILIENEKRSEFCTLREKLHWGHPPRYGV